MTEPSRPPEAAYGVLHRDPDGTAVEAAVEQVRRLGYAILDSGFDADALHGLSEAFDAARARYLARHGEARLRRLDEHNTIRAPLLEGGTPFLGLAFAEPLMRAVSALIDGKFVLNQQNGVINPSREPYNQGAWHRDLPYQHFVSSRPLAINALFCVDDFTHENGSTWVLPASHKAEAFPSDDYVRRNAVQVTARAGQFVLLDCMLFHAGGRNDSERPRRAVNHVFTIPYLKQQIALPQHLDAAALTPLQREVLGFAYREPASVDDWLDGRERRAG